MYDVKGTNFVAMDQDEYLEHFGTKGMKWGHRKASGSNARNGVTKDQVKSAKSRMKAASKTTTSKYEKAAGDYYNIKRQFKGKSTRSNISASRIQMYKNSGASFLKRAAIAGILYTGLAAAITTPKQKQELKAGAQYAAAQGVRSVAVLLGSVAGKVSRSASESGTINKVANAVRRSKKYGKYINTTGFSVPSASRLIGS